MHFLSYGLTERQKIRQPDLELFGPPPISQYDENRREIGNFRFPLSFPYYFAVFSYHFFKAQFRLC